MAFSFSVYYELVIPGVCFNTRMMSGIVITFTGLFCESFRNILFLLYYCKWELDQPCSMLWEDNSILSLVVLTNDFIIR